MDEQTIIKNFVRWLKNNGYEICGWTLSDEYIPARKSPEQWALEATMTTDEIRKEIAAQNKMLEDLGIIRKDR